MSATTYETTHDFQSSAAPDLQPGAHTTPASASAAMAPRVYRGRSIEELIPKIQVELGRDAIILRRRSGLTGGIAGFFQRRFVEIEARPGTPRVDLYDEANAAPQEDREGTAMALMRDETPAVPPQSAAATPPHAAMPPPPQTAAFDSAAHADATPDAPAAFVAPHPGRVWTPESNGSPGAPAMNGGDTFTGAQEVDAPAIGAAAEGSHADRMRTYSGHQDRPLRSGDAAAPGVVAQAAMPGAAAPVSMPLSAGLQTPGADWPGAGAQQANGHHADGVDSFRELTPESLLAGPQQRNGSAPAPSPPSSPPSPPPSSPGAGDSFAAALAQAEEAFPRSGIEERLFELGVGEQLVAELVEIASRETLGLLSPEASLADAVRLVLRVRIPRCAPLPTRSATIALVGPGGSGKTAVCTALIENHRKHEPQPVACASVVARERPGGHAMLLAPEILEPTPIADPHAAGALRSARENGLLLLDMPSVSPGDRGSVYDLAALLDTLQPDRVVLALPATLGARPAAQLLQAMRPLGASAIAITHADETDQLGVAVDAACAFGLAPEYLLDYSHQDGLLRIDPAYLADRLLP